MFIFIIRKLIFIRKLIVNFYNKKTFTSDLYLLFPSIKAMFRLYRITLRPTQKPYRIGLLFTYEMLLSSQFLQRTGGAAVRSSKWCAVYRIGFCNALIAM